MKVAVVGLGQIGGSMALRMRKLGIDTELYDINEKTAKLLGGKCEKFNAIGYDLVVLALHIPVILELIENLPRENLYLDTASVKEQVVNKAKERGLHFVGGHPIAGNEKIGPESWDKNLFEGRKFVLVDVHSTKEERGKIEKFVEMLGSEPLWTTVEEHDRALAYTSHAPYFVSLAIKRIGEKFEEYAGPGYSSMTRLAKQDPKLGEVFKLYNAHNTASALRTVANEILKIANEVERW